MARDDTHAQGNTAGWHAGTEWVGAGGCHVNHGSGIQGKGCMCTHPSAACTLQVAAQCSTASACSACASSPSAVCVTRRAERRGEGCR